MRNPNKNNESDNEDWEVLSDDWTEANAESQGVSVDERAAVNDEAEENSQEPPEKKDGASKTQKEIVCQQDDDVISEIDEDIVSEEEICVAADNDDVLSLDENQLLLNDEEEKNTSEEEEESSKEDNGDNDEEEEVTSPGLTVLKEMGFASDKAQEALYYSNGDMDQAISDLLGEHKEWHALNRVRKDAAVQLKQVAKEVVDTFQLKEVGKAVGVAAYEVGKAVETGAKEIGKAVGSGAKEVKKAYKDHNVDQKAKMAAHHAKLTALAVGREVHTLNEKYHITETIATVGVVVAAALLAKGNPRAATTTAAVAGTTYVAGESMRTCRGRGREEIYE